MAYLALDLGSTMGWAVCCQGVYEAGEIKLQKKPKELYGLRFDIFQSKMREFVHFWKPETVFYEQVRRHMSTDSAHVYGGFQAIMCMVFSRYSIPVVGLPVGTIKKHASGNGAAKKEQMIAAAKHQWPDIDITSDNVADALHILRLGLTTL